MTIKKTNKALSLLPVFGICLYLILYGVATLLYPGGSFADKTTKGFSWLHNYWCELMAPVAQNGMINTARPAAITGLFVLAASLSIFWYRAPLLFNNTRRSFWLIRYPGIFSMCALLLFFVLPHDLAVNTATVPGLIALFGVLAGLYKNRLWPLLGLGIFCLLLCLLNSYIYYGPVSMYYLPVIQKISFFFFLLWFSLVTIRLDLEPLE